MIQYVLFGINMQVVVKTAQASSFPPSNKWFRNPFGPISEDTSSLHVWLKWQFGAVAFQKCINREQ